LFYVETLATEISTDVENQCEQFQTLHSYWFWWFIPTKC